MAQRNIQVIKTKDPNIVQYLIPSFENFFKKAKVDYKLESFLKWYRFNLQNPLVCTWVVIQKGNSLFQNDTGILGYLIGTITSNLEVEYFNVTQIYSKEKYATELLIKTVLSWVKQNGLKSIAGVTNRNYKAFERKFGLRLISYNLLKEI